MLAEGGQLLGALVTIDAIATKRLLCAGHAGRDRRQDSRPRSRLPAALKGNQPTLEKEAEDYFKTAPATELAVKTTMEKGHGRIETRIFTISGTIDWIAPDRSFPGAPRFRGIKSIVKVVNRLEYKDRCSTDTRHYICSAPPNVERLAKGSRGHWGVESMHWLLDVEFKDDLSRYRTGHGAKNMAALRRFALNLVRNSKIKASMKVKRKSAGWNTDTLLEILQINPR